jgi:hypothetical protein
MDPLQAVSLNYPSLSIRDLLDARDLAHFHLTNKQNVVGTAIGLYLIRHEEPWPKKRGQGTAPSKPKKGERTLTNSEVRDYSWPCVLVFVREWVTKEAFKKQHHDPLDMIPNRIDMPDGRSVPICVVKADEVDDDLDEQPLVGRWPTSWLGGGMPIFTRVQEFDRQATIGCIVSDGHLRYALTARHACGEPGTVVRSRLRGGDVKIGKASSKQLTRLPFNQVYPSFTARQSYLSLDVGLVELNNINDWTQNTYGLPAVGFIADLYEQNLTLRLIDRPVVAFGAATGLLRGTIKALFYRYRSVGGYDYIADLLIAPNQNTPHSRHGDSGAVWHLDVTDDEPGKPPKELAQRELRPLAIEWGGQRFADVNRRTNFAVATSLSNVCKLLDVDLTSNLNRGVQGYWGRVGHYSIGSFAVQLLTGKLSILMGTNLENLSYDLGIIRDEDLDDKIKNATFVPLADVPDEVWKKFRTHPGGRDVQVIGDGRTTGPEHPNHYADIDHPYEGHNLRFWCLQDSKYLTVEEWTRFYDSLTPPIEEFRRGILPFRVWQYFAEMVEFVRRNQIDRFVAAAGTLAHYVGDACQPLHGSMYSDGDPSRTVQRRHPRTGELETVNYGKGVHSAYETKMIDRRKDDLLKAIRDALPKDGHRLQPVTSGKSAAGAIVQLMDDVVSKIQLQPMEICDLYESLGANTHVATLDKMWDDLGERTAKAMALGIRYLAMIWESAWEQGGGARIADSALVKVDPDNIRELYLNTDFMRSFSLSQIGPALLSVDAIVGTRLN